jgi:hypothetical protein
MVQQTDELRRDMQERRAAISDTVDQIQNRVSPSHVAARGRYRVRTRVVRWKDNIMGQMEQGDGGMRERAGEMTESVRQAPSAVERYTRGNPVAVGLMAVGAGALIASMLPETRQEQRMAQRIQPEMEKAASEMKEAGREVAEDVKDTAQEGMSRVQESAKSAGQEVKEEARGAGHRVGGDSR